MSLIGVTGDYWASWWLLVVLGMSDGGTSVRFEFSISQVSAESINTLIRWILLKNLFDIIKLNLTLGLKLYFLCYIKVPKLYSIFETFLRQKYSSVASPSQNYLYGDVWKKLNIRQDWTLLSSWTDPLVLLVHLVGSPSNLWNSWSCLHWRLEIWSGLFLVEIPDFRNQLVRCLLNMRAWTS